jgi:hypothetical protein
VHGLEARYSDQMNFVYLDIDDQNTNRFKQQLDYRYQPHIFLLGADGTILEQWVGFVPGEVLEDAFVRVLADT